MREFSSFPSSQPFLDCFSHGIKTLIFPTTKPKTKPKTFFQHDYIKILLKSNSKWNKRGRREQSRLKTILPEEKEYVHVIASAKLTNLSSLKQTPFPQLKPGLSNSPSFSNNYGFKWASYSCLMKALVRLNPGYQ